MRTLTLGEGVDDPLGSPHPEKTVQLEQIVFPFETSLEIVLGVRPVKKKYFLTGIS